MKKNFKKSVAAMVSAGMLVSSVSTFATVVEYGEELKNDPGIQYNERFSDVKSDYWAYKYIEEMAERNILVGYEDGTYRPNETITRAEFAKIITLAFNGSIRNDYKYVDVNDSDWFSEYVDIAGPYLTDYVDENDNHYYRPDKKVLREDVVSSLVKIKGYDVSNADITILSTRFTDSDSISYSLRKYIVTGLNRGIASGYNDNTFRGQNMVTRAEAAAMVWRAYQYQDDNKVVGMEPIETPDSNIINEPTVSPEPTPTPSPTEKPLYDFSELNVNKITGGDFININDNRQYVFDENKLYTYNIDGNINEYIFDDDSVTFIKTYNISITDKESVISLGYNPYSSSIYIATINEEDETGSIYVIHTVDASSIKITSDNTILYNPTSEITDVGFSVHPYFQYKFSYVDEYQFMYGNYLINETNGDIESVEINQEAVNYATDSDGNVIGIYYFELYDNHEHYIFAPMMYKYPKNQNMYEQEGINGNLLGVSNDAFYVYNWYSTSTIYRVSYNGGFSIKYYNTKNQSFGSELNKNQTIINDKLLVLSNDNNINIITFM